MNMKLATARRCPFLRMGWILFSVGTYLVPTNAHAWGVLEQFCRWLNQPNCENVLSKQVVTRGSRGEFASNIIIYDRATDDRTRIPCGQCRDPIPISASQFAIRTATGLAIVSLPDGNVVQSFALPNIRLLLAVVSSTNKWVVAIGDKSCPDLALFDPSTEQLFPGEIADEAEESCPLPRPGRIKDKSQIFLAGDHGSSFIVSSSIKSPTSDRVVVVPRAPGDSSTWFDPQWFNERVIYATD